MQSDSILLLKSDNTPLPKGPGILLAVAQQGTDAPGKEAWLHGSLALSEKDLKWAPADVWFRSLSIIAISRSNQFPYRSGIIGDRLVFPEEIHALPSAGGSDLTCLAFNLKPGHSLGLKPETYYVHVACLSHRSDPIEIRIG